MSLRIRFHPFLFLAILPALLFGTYTMAFSEVLRTLWMMQLGFGMIGIALQWAFFRFRPAVDYVEGILTLAWKISVFFGICSALSLVFASSSFFCFGQPRK